MRPAKRCHLRRCRSAALAMCTRVRKARLACGSGASSFESYARVRPTRTGTWSPDRLCIPSRAASHRLNVKIGKNVNNHEGSRKKRTSRSRTARRAGRAVDARQLGARQRRRRGARQARVPGPDGRASAVDAGYDRDRLGPRETCAKTEGRDGDAAVQPPVGATVGAGCLRLPCTRQGRAAAVARLTVTVD